NITKCQICEGSLPTLPCKCSFCGGKFCGHHRIPENHYCPGKYRRNNI
ncbi:MAG: rhomboid family intramembrane serine protease, partial [archaeon]|nr:rhomboid family intramembrane serine protease [archaeon]